MRRKNFAPGKALKQFKSARRRFRLMIAEDTDEEVLLHCYLRVCAAHLEGRKLAERSIHISMTSFNLNRLSEEECYHHFRFRPKHIGKIVELCGWNEGKTKRRGYIVDTVTATCLAFRKLSFPTRWRDMEDMFGMQPPAMSETFYEVIEKLIQ